MKYAPIIVIIVLAFGLLIFTYLKKRNEAFEGVILNKLDREIRTNTPALGLQPDMAGGQVYGASRVFTVHIQTGVGKKIY